MSPDERPTLLRPPEDDPTKAPIENAIEVTELGVLGPDIFTNTRVPWHPPGARGIYGGSVISQCLASAQKTVPDDFLPHSCHCYFLLAGSSEIPILFHVERVRDGRSFATRTVQARQRGRCIFTTTVSFARDNENAEKKQKSLEHAAPLPEHALESLPTDDHEDDAQALHSSSPLVRTDICVTGSANGDPDERHNRRCHTWIRARGKVSSEGGIRAHLDALAYMSDSFMVGTIARIHNTWRFRFEPSDVAKMPEAQRKETMELLVKEGMGSTLEEWEAKPKLGMMVSLDHSIYFHEPRRVRADEWMFMQMETSWAAHGRGLVIQRIFAKDGTLLASCVQEGAVRLRRDGSEQSAKL